jgi:hypothetical protein
VPAFLPRLLVLHNFKMVEGGFMKRFFQITWGLFLVFYCWSGPTLAQESQGPKMVIKNQVFDFGEVKEGEDIQHTFHVFNECGETLLIKDVKPG